MDSIPIVVAETNGVLDDRLSVCVIKLDNGRYVMGAHAPSPIEAFNPLTGQKAAVEAAYEKLAARDYV